MGGGHADEKAHKGAIDCANLRVLSSTVELDPNCEIRATAARTIGGRGAQLALVSPAPSPPHLLIARCTPIARKRAATHPPEDK